MFEGDRLRFLIRECGMTKTDFARATRISPQAVNKYLRNERQPSSVILARMAEVFGVTTDYLMGFDSNTTGRTPKSAYYGTLKTIREFREAWGQDTCMDLIRELTGGGAN